MLKLKGELKLKGNLVDARGRSCPEPVLSTKKAIEASPDGVKVLVDNATARENIKRFAKNSGYNVEVVENDEGILLTLSR